MDDNSQDFTELMTEHICFRKSSWERLRMRAKWCEKDMHRMPGMKK